MSTQTWIICLFIYLGNVAFSKWFGLSSKRVHFFRTPQLALLENCLQAKDHLYVGHMFMQHYPLKQYQINQRHNPSDENTPKNIT